MPKIINVKYSEPRNLFVEYANGVKGTVSVDEVLNHKDYVDIKDTVDVTNVSLAEDGDILIDGKVRLCRNATYGILELKEQMRKLGLEL